MVRVIARLDIKGDKLIKSVQLEGVRVVGDPKVAADRCYQEGADEIILMDAVASLYGRNNLSEIISYTAQNTLVPITVGGGLRSLADVEATLRAGADKIAINTAAMSRPELISDVAKTFGSQCMVLQIDAKYRSEDNWEAYVEGGRERTHKDAIAWAKQGYELGAGEILVTSVDREGTRKGFDLRLVYSVSNAVGVPVIASGGAGCIKDLCDVVSIGRADAFAVADMIHLQDTTIDKIKSELLVQGLAVRPL